MESNLFEEKSLLNTSEQIKVQKIIEVEIPPNFYNCGVSVDNFFIADTNNSTNWQTLKFPLPTPPYSKWSILKYEISHKEKTIVLLISK